MRTPKTPLMLALDCALIDYLRHDLAIPTESIALGLRQTPDAAHLLPVVLWQYGLISIEQLEHIFEWLEHHAATARHCDSSGLNWPDRGISGNATVGGKSDFLVA